jgi:hypothetical protein
MNPSFAADHVVRRVRIRTPDISADVQEKGTDLFIHTTSRVLARGRRE